MSLRGELGRSLRRWRWFCDIRRLQAEGLGNAAARWHRWANILRTPPVRTDSAGSTEIHLLCHKGDYLCAIWALKTLYLTAQARWPVTIHLQGATSRTMMGRLSAHFPSARIIGPREADERVSHALAHTHPKLLECRRQAVMMMKLVDPVVLAQADRIFLLDSDVLFFRQPVELLHYVEDCTADDFICQHDLESNYNLSEAEAAEAFGIRMPSRVNAGICLFPRSLVDFTLCESLLDHPKVRQLTGLIEQTLYALCAGARGGVRYLSHDYLISLERGIHYGGLIARHYAGPSRPMLTEEGMPYVMASGILHG